MRPRQTYGGTIAIIVLSALAGWYGSPISADPPPGYYDTVDAGSQAALRATVHAVIDDHTRFPYSSSGTDAWTILELADEDPNNATRILDVYKNASYAKVGGGNAFYDREHTWPNSYGFPDDNAQNYPFSDCHQLFLCTSSYNSSRGNKPFGTCSAVCLEMVTDVNDGQGGGGGAYPGNSNWTSGSGSSGTWETWVGRRGDVARAQFYLDVRYEGGTHGVTGAAEPNLILTNNTELIAASNTGNNESTAYMGLLSVLLEWHVQDPVDDRERARNDAVFSFQGNRNPFIDHPEWVDCLFAGNCGSGTAPAAPTGLTANPGDAVVMLDWNDNGDADLAGYNVYRAPASVGPFSPLNGPLVAASAYTDASVVNNTTYYYRVTAVDADVNESAPSITVAATPTAGGGPVDSPWINEIHYDNVGTDADEGIEIAGPAGLSLTGWKLLGYNGSGSLLYLTVNLSGVLPNQQNGFGTLWFTFTGLQNGSPDGIALVDPSDEVVHFLSYEGVFTAVGGAASGMASTDIGVQEPGADPVGLSLQLQGEGSQYSDFTWSPSMPNTRGAVNVNQTFPAGPPIPTVSAIGAGVMGVLILGCAIAVLKRRQNNHG